MAEEDPQKGFPRWGRESSAGTLSGASSIFIPTSLKPLLSKRRITSPTSRRCTPSGFTATRVRSRLPKGPPLEEEGSGMLPHLSCLLTGFPCQGPGVTWGYSVCLRQSGSGGG